MTFLRLIIGFAFRGAVRTASLMPSEIKPYALQLRGLLLWLCSFLL